MSQATAPKAKNSVLQTETLTRILGADAVQILKCSICLEFFDVPIVLPCGHTFCLHCLTEMCRHASRNNAHASLQDTRISCPNCRVLIYASPVLERNVTCNFIIQSLIELLKAREERQVQTKATNTDEVRIGTKIRTPSDSDVARLLQDLDRMTEALGRSNVVDSAYFEIDDVRRAHLAREAGVEVETDPRTRHSAQAFDNSKLQPGRQSNHKTFPFNANPITPFDNITSSVSVNNTIPKANRANKNLFCHQSQLHHCQQLTLVTPPSQPPPPPPARRTVAQHHLPNRYHHQQPFGVTKTPWLLEYLTKGNPAKMLSPATGSVPHQSAMPQASTPVKPEAVSGVNSDFRFLPINMAVGCSIKGCPVVVNHNRKQDSKEQTPVCTVRLDNDPAIMSYSCTSTCHLANLTHRS